MPDKKQTDIHKQLFWKSFMERLHDSRGVQAGAPQTSPVPEPSPQPEPAWVRSVHGAASELTDIVKVPVEAAWSAATGKGTTTGAQRVIDETKEDFLQFWDQGKSLVTGQQLPRGQNHAELAGRNLAKAATMIPRAGSQAIQTGVFGAAAIAQHQWEKAKQQYNDWRSHGVSGRSR